MLTVLVNEHSDWYPAQVETVQKILNILISDWILTKYFFIFNHTLGHSWYNIIVPVSDVDQSIYKPVCILKSVKMCNEQWRTYLGNIWPQNQGKKAYFYYVIFMTIIHINLFNSQFCNTNDNFCRKICLISMKIMANINESKILMTKTLC